MNYLFAPNLNLNLFSQPAQGKIIPLILCQFLFNLRGILLVDIHDSLELSCRRLIYYIIISLTDVFFHRLEGICVISQILSCNFKRLS